MPKQILKSRKLRNSKYYDTQELFDGLYERSSKGEIFTNLMGPIISDNNVRLAYRNIRNNGGSDTAGVDGYTIEQVKSLSEKEFIEKVKAKLKWYKPKAVRRDEHLGEHHYPHHDLYGDGFLNIDFSEQTATLAGKPIDFTPKEYKTLLLFIKNSRLILTKTQLF